MKVLAITGYLGPYGGYRYSSTLFWRWGGGLAPRFGRFTSGKDPVPIVQEVGCAPRPFWTGGKNLAPTGIRSPDRPARSESLYRLSYPGRHVRTNLRKKKCVCITCIHKFCLKYFSLRQHPTCLARCDWKRGKNASPSLWNMTFFSISIKIRIAWPLSFWVSHTKFKTKRVYRFRHWHVTNRRTDSSPHKASY